MPKKHTILLVDGDARDRAAIRKTLEQRRYRVIEAADYWEALEAHQAHQGEIELLLTALALPGDNGYELARALFRKDLRIKALFVSGRAGAEVSPYYHMPMTGSHLLTKPLHDDELIDRVREVLGTRASQSRTEIGSAAGRKIHVKSESE